MIVILVTLIYISLYSFDLYNEKLYMQIFCKAYYHRPEF